MYERILVGSWSNRAWHTIGYMIWCVNDAVAYVYLGFVPPRRKDGRLIADITDIRP